MPITFRARILFPVDRPPIENGVVTIEGERIVAVGAASRDSHPVRDLGDVALLPGLVNAHTHLEYSHLPQPLGRPGMPLIEWLQLAIAERQNRSHSAMSSIAAGIEESKLAGTCAIGEIATANSSAYASSTGVAITSFQEVIGFSRARADSAFAALEERLASPPPATVLGLSPHAPYTVSPVLLRKLIDLARARNLPIAMHLAESADELDLLAAGSGPFQKLLEERSMWDSTAIPLGSRPLDYLRLLADAPRALVIHGNYLDREEHDFLAAYANRMTLVYCPRTHTYFHHPPYPLAAILAAGVNVAMGTDSRASNSDLSMLAEIRHAVRAHPNVPADAILRMATLNAASALGYDDECGSITPGKLANLIAIKASSDSLADILADGEPISKVWLRGGEVGEALSSAS